MKMYSFFVLPGSIEMLSLSCSSRVGRTLSVRVLRGKVARSPRKLRLEASCHRLGPTDTSTKQCFLVIGYLGWDLLRLLLCEVWAFECSRQQLLVVEVPPALLALFLMYSLTRKLESRMLLIVFVGMIFHISLPTKFGGSVDLFDPFSWNEGELFFFFLRASLLNL